MIVCLRSDPSQEAQPYAGCPQPGIELCLNADESFAWRSLDSDWGTDVALPTEREGASLTCIAEKQVSLTIPTPAPMQQLCSLIHHA